MAESATRDVIFRMKAEPSKEALANAEKFGKSLERVQFKSIDSVDKRRQQSIDTLSRMSKATVDLERKASKEISALINSRIALRKKELNLGGRSGTAATPGKPSARRGPGGDDLTKRLREEQKAREKAAKEFDKRLAKEQAERDKASKEAAKRFQKEINDRIKLRDREAKEADRLRQQQEREEARIHQRHRKRQQSIAADHRKQREQETREAVREAEKQAKAEERIRKEQEKEEARIHKRKRQRQRSIAQQNRKARQQEAKDAQAAIRATEEQMAQATGRMQAANSVLVEGVTSAGESAVRFATGLTTVGLVSEENNEKLLRGLVLMRGINDTVAGSINLWVRTGKIVQGYKATLDAVKATQAAILAQQTLMGPGGRGVGRGAARGAGRSVVGGVANFAGTVAGGAVAQRIGAAGAAGRAAAAGKAATSLSALQKVALGAGRGISALGAAASKVAGPLAVAGGLLAGAETLIGLLTTGKLAPRPGGPTGRTATALGEASAGIGSFASRALPGVVLEGFAKSKDSAILDTLTGGTASLADTELRRRKSNRMKAAQIERRDREATGREQISQQIGRAELQADARLQPFESAVQMASGKDKIQAIDQAQEEIDKQKKAIQAIDLGKGGDSAESRLEQLEALTGLQQRAVEFAEQRKATELEILRSKKEQAEVAITSSREELQNAEATRDAAKDRISAIKSSLQSAAVRFAQMGKEEQQELLDLSKRAQAGEQLSVEEASKLLRSGIGRSRDIAEKQLFEAAQREGFFKVEGVGLREQLKREEEIVKRQQAIVNRVQSKIKVKQEFLVTVDESAEKLKDTVLSETRELLRQVEQQGNVRIQANEERIQAIERNRRQNAGG